jgi:long-chain acyl-CoA synthetase
MEARIWHQHYDPGVGTSIDYPDLTVEQLLTKTSKKSPDDIAIIFGGLLPLLGERHGKMTYQQLNELVDRFAAGLQRLGLEKGERVALHLPNCPQYVIAYYGILRAGGVVVPCNPLYVPRELKHQLNDAGARFAVTLSLLYKNLRQVREDTALEQVIVTNIKEYFPGLLKTLFTLMREQKDGHRVDISNDANTHWFQDMLADAPELPESVEISGEDTAVLMYTGGTTGVPKGAELRHRNIVANAMQEGVWLGGDAHHDVMLTALPLTHSYAMTACMNYSIIYGHTQVLVPNPRDLPFVLTCINVHKPTIFPGVPALYNAIINNPDVKAGKYDLKSIKTCVTAAAGVPLEVQQAFERIAGSRLVEAYGLSEASPGVTCNPINGGRHGTIGVPVPDTDAKIVDLDDEIETLGPDKTGLLCIRGPQVMRGYWNMPDETASVLRRHADGHLWLHTGDIAQMSEDGYFRLVDRKKDMILAGGGYNVFPRDIEERLYEHPKVMEAAAIGVPVGSSNQRAKVFVVLQPGESATEAEIIDWCREGLARYKVPKFVEFRDELPKTVVGKVFRRELSTQEEAANNQ